MFCYCFCFPFPPYLHQTYLYQSYRRQMKYYKVLVMLYKIGLLLALTFLTSEASTSNMDEDESAVQQAGLAFTVVFIGLTVAFVGRPHQASNENILDIMFWGTNTINAFLTLLLASDAISPTPVVAYFILFPNVTALGMFIGTRCDTPEGFPTVLLGVRIHGYPMV